MASFLAFLGTLGLAHHFDVGVGQASLYAYLAMVAASGLYGGTKGFGKWLEWLSRRKKITVSQELIDPVLNIGRDGGFMGYYTLSGAGLSAAITGTFPVSIPLLTYFSKEVNDGDDGNQAHRRD